MELTRTVPADDWTDTFSLEQPLLYIHAQLTDRDGDMLALSNPLWIDPRAVLP